MSALDTFLTSHQLRASLAAATVPSGAACRGRGPWWEDLEAKTLAARDRRRTIAACLSQIAPLCGACPAAEACRNWAIIERYTGYAAGSYMYNGRTHTTIDIATTTAA